MYIFTQKLCEIIPKHDDYLSQYGETWIQVYAFVCFEREGILPCCILGKIARYYLYIYTPIRDLGGGGYGSAHQFTPSNTHAHMQTHTNTQGGKGEPKTGKRKTRKPSSLWCENENKTRWKSKSIKYKVVDFLVALLTLHHHKMQVNLLFYN